MERNVKRRLEWPPPEMIARLIDKGNLTLSTTRFQRWSVTSEKEWTKAAFFNKKTGAFVLRFQVINVFSEVGF